MNFKITNQKTSSVLFARSKVANTFMARLLGLMLKRPITKDEALIFYRANSIHTCFMRFPIDIIFLDKNFTVLKIYMAVKPFRSVFCKDAFCTIECLGGSASEKGLNINDRIKIEEQPDASKV